jgi:hypothetical protein
VTLKLRASGTAITLHDAAAPGHVHCLASDLEMLLNAHALRTLTPAERLILANQYAILEALFPADRARYALKRQIVENDAAEESPSLARDCNTPPACNRTDRAHRLGRATGSVDRGGALTPW